MVFRRLAALAMAFFAGTTFAAPLGAQTTATLNVSARVVQECTVSFNSKRELVKLARRLNDPGLIQRCSKGVVSRVDRRVVKGGNLRPLRGVAPDVSGKRVTRSTVGGKGDVMLVTVSY